MRDELWSLLEAHAVDGDGFERLARGERAAPFSHDGPSAPMADALSDALSDVLSVGTRIGVWRVGQLINVGGAGEVYFATRADGAFEQRAALKRLHRETAPDHARFLAERQFLASLDHPGIARLLDGGVADDGRLYAVVEYVDGLPLIEHCRVRRADLAYRLALFVEVCEVVSYAHRNLIVHRDLKPGNILVTAEGRVRLLDFGVAKRLDRDVEAVDRTTAPFTSDYAAPEQLTGAPITTATDVYALGVVLFELLTHERPWHSKGLPIARIVQAIVHGEPRAASVAAAEHDGPVAPSRLVGDLDAIVATCLRKEAAKRYSTVDALRRDVERHLAHEPVAARGRARSYVFGRAVRRYRWAVTAGGLVFASLAVGLAATIWQARRAGIERDVARTAATREEAIRDQITNLFRASIAEKSDAPITAKGMLDRSARRVLVEYRDDPQLVGKVVVTLADLYGALEDNEGQASLLESYLAATGPNADAESVATAQQQLASNKLVHGQPKEAASLLAHAEAFWATAPDRYREQELEAMFVRGQLTRARGDIDGSIDVFRQAIAERTAFSGPVHRETANLYNSLAISLSGANRLDEALTAYRADLDILTKLGQGDDLGAAVIRGNTGTLMLRMGRVHEAEAILKDSIAQQRERAGDSAAVASSMGLYGACLTVLGRPAEAVETLRTAVDLATRFAGKGSPVAIQDTALLTDALIADHRFAEARELGAVNLVAARGRFGEGSMLTLRTRLVMARIALDSGDPADGYGQFTALLEPLRHVGAVGQPWVAQALLGTGEALLAEGRPSDAIAPLREAVSLRERLLWSESWELAAARSRLGEALRRTNDPSGTALLRQSVDVLVAQLGETHPLVAQARRALGQPA